MTRLFTENIPLKALSLGVAVLLWLATVGGGNVTTAVAVPIQYRNLPANLEISSDLVDSAYIELRGASDRLSGSSLANALVVLDLSEQDRPGERTYSILNDTVQLPPGVEFLRAIPSQIRLRLEPRVSRETLVVVRYAPKLPDGWAIQAQQVSPQTVKVVGPDSHVQAVDRVQTDPIELQAVPSEQVFRVHAFTGDPLVRLERSNVTITVRVTLQKSP